MLSSKRLYSSKALWVLFVCLLACLSVRAQLPPAFSYDRDLLPATFFQRNREALRQQMPDSSIAVLFANPVRNRSNDVDYVYHQDPNFYYLTGFPDADAVLLVFKQPYRWITGDSILEMLIIPERDPSDELWTGRLADAQDILNCCQISHITVSSDTLALHLPYDQFRSVLTLRLPQGVVNDRSDSGELFDLLERFKRLTSPSNVNTDDYQLGKIMARLRQIKSAEEIEMLQKAVDISVASHLEMMKSLTEGMHEYEIEAVGEYGFHRRGAEDVGYPSICGGGENGCVLHYMKNRRTLDSMDLVVLDMGAEYHGYTADITRTLPVSGAFSKDQRTVYDLVWEAQQAGIAACRAGQAFKDPHKAAYEVIKNGLKKLGIARTDEEVKRYFPHGTSHYLGLDVHDVGDYQPLQPGQVITVEPGIYIPVDSPCDPRWWNIGIRIEDDVLITENEPFVMSKGLPSTSYEVEKYMQSGRK